MEELTDKQKELLKYCKYYKGEKECPFDADYSYETLLSNPMAYWWYAEREVILLEFESLSKGIKCKIYKHMEYSPLNEKECEISYKTSLLKKS